MAAALLISLGGCQTPAPAVQAPQEPVARPAPESLYLEPLALGDIQLSVTRGKASAVFEGKDFTLAVRPLSFPYGGSFLIVRIRNKTERALRFSEEAMYLEASDDGEVWSESKLAGPEARRDLGPLRDYQPLKESDVLAKSTFEGYIEIDLEAAHPRHKLYRLSLGVGDTTTLFEFLSVPAQ
jgi:hypothetical protein